MGRQLHSSFTGAAWQPELAITFSLSGDDVWASWPGRTGAVKLGQCDLVTHMMRDFLAQCALGERLASGDHEASARLSNGDR